MTKFSGPFNSIRSEKSTISKDAPRLFTFAARSPEKKTNDDEENSQEKTLLHGTPSKKDFLDQVKKLHQNDRIDEEKDEKEEISTDHDLQRYTSTPKVQSIPSVVSKAKPVEENENIVSFECRENEK